MRGALGQACTDPRLLAELDTLAQHLAACNAAERTLLCDRKALRTPAADGARVTITLASSEASLLWACVAIVLWAEDLAT